MTGLGLALLVAGGALTPQARAQGVSDLIGETVGPVIEPARADILSCPFDALRTAYLSLYTDVDQLNVNALESQVLRICTERQDQISKILDNERDLKALLKEASGPDGTPLPSLVPTVTPGPDAGSDAARVSALEAELEALKAAKTAEIGPPDTLGCVAPFRVAAILGSPVLGKGLSAVIRDTATGGQMTVREGDALPGGLVVEEVNSEGVTVGLGGQRERLLPVASRPEISDGGGLIPEPATIPELFGAPEGPGPGGVQ